jgi:hypothetical protein
MISQTPIMHYLDYYKAWFNALHNANKLTDMKDVHKKGSTFMAILTELWDADMLDIKIVERYAEEIVNTTRKKENTYYN